MFGASSGLFFVFFGACQCFCISHVKIMMKKVCFTRVLDPPNAWNIGIYSVFSSFLMKIHSPTGCRPQKKHIYSTPMYPKADFKCNLPEFWDWILLFYLFGGSAYRNSGLKTFHQSKALNKRFPKENTSGHQISKISNTSKNSGACWFLDFASADCHSMEILLAIDKYFKKQHSGLS